MIFIDEENAFRKIQHSFFNINSQQSKNRRELFQLGKSISEKLTAAPHLIIKDSLFPRKIRNKAKGPTLSTSITYCTGSSIKCNNKGKRNK